MAEDKRPVDDDAGELLMPSQVVRLFQVDSKTVDRWTQEGKLTPVRTPGGHRRFRASEIRRRLDDGAGEERRE